MYDQRIPHLQKKLCLWSCYMHASALHFMYLCMSNVPT